MKEYHAGNKVVSPETIDFLSVGANSASSPAPPAPSGNTVADEIQATCGDTAGCYSSPDGCSGSTCSYLVAYTQKDDVIEFAATGLVPSDLGEDFYLTVGVGPEPVMVRWQSSEHPQANVWNNDDVINRLCIEWGSDHGDSDYYTSLNKIPITPQPHYFLPVTCRHG